MALATSILKTNPEYGSVVAYSRGEKIQDSHPFIQHKIWNTDNSSQVENSLGKVKFEKNDLVIISLGHLNKNYFVSDPKSVINFDEIHSGINSNLTVPLSVLAYSVNALARIGGGKIVLLSSAAAFPPLEPNSIYSSAKLALDAFACDIAEQSRKQKVYITIIRPGFIPTKLNANRKATIFNTTLDALTTKYLRSGVKKVIWEPGILKFVTFAILNSRILKKIATGKFKTSHQID